MVKASVGRELGPQFPERVPSLTMRQNPPVTVTGRGLSMVTVGGVAALTTVASVITAAPKAPTLFFVVIVHRIVTGLMDGFNLAPSRNSWLRPLDRHSCLRRRHRKRSPPSPPTAYLPKSACDVDSGARVYHPVLGPRREAIGPGRVRPGRSQQHVLSHAVLAEDCSQVPRHGCSPASRQRERTPAKPGHIA